MSPVLSEYWRVETSHVVCLITQAPIPGSESLYAQMMVAYQQMVSVYSLFQWQCELQITQVQASCYALYLCTVGLTYYDVSF